jgi:hypothetical protein
MPKTLLKPATVAPSAIAPKVADIVEPIEAASKPALPKAAKVAAPKSEKKIIGKGPKEPRVKLTEGPYNFALARLRRISQDHFSEGDTSKKSLLTTELRKKTTFLDVKAAIVEEAGLVDSLGFDKFLSEHFFIAAPAKE